MSRKTKKIKLSNYEVEIYENLTWGEVQDIEDVLISGIEVDNSGVKNIKNNIIREQKYKLFEICIAKIIDKDGNKIEYSKEWIDNLDYNEGDLLYKELDNIYKKK